MKQEILPRNFYQRDTPEVARDLLGKKLIRVLPDGTVLSGIISETEAYRSDDPACHAYKRKTERNQTLFGQPGHAYVYLSYGLHYCLNIVSYDKNHSCAGGVLIRAIIPLSGLDYMRKQRNNIRDTELTNGPGKLGQALSITKELNGIDITQSRSLLLVTDGYIIDQVDIKVTPRIGLSVGTETLWRFMLSPKKINEIRESLHNKNI